MKRYLIAATAIAGLVLTYVGARAVERSPLLGVYNADNASFYCGLLVYPACSFGPEGQVYTTSATVATAAGTAEQVLGTYSLPANALDIAGRRVRIRASFHLATNGNNKTIKLYFGASVITSGVLTDSNKNAWLSMDVVKSGASTQIVTATGQHDTTMTTPYLNAGTDTDTAAIVIKASGTDGTDSAGDIVLEQFYVEYLS